MIIYLRNIILRQSWYNSQFKSSNECLKWWAITGIFSLISMGDRFTKFSKVGLLHVNYQLNDEYKVLLWSLLLTLLRQRQALGCIACCWLWVSWSWRPWGGTYERERRKLDHRPKMTRNSLHLLPERRNKQNDCKISQYRNMI